MPKFEIELPGGGMPGGGRRFEVEAPDMETASKMAQQHARESQPWLQFNKATQSGQKPELGQEFPGGGYIPTKGEAGADLGMLGAMLIAGPVASSITKGAAPFLSGTLAPAAARTAVATTPGLVEGNPGKAAWGAGANLGVEALASVLGLPGMTWNRWSQNRPPMVHQAVNSPPGGKLYAPSGQVAREWQPPIEINRVGGSKVSVQPPSSGTWANSPETPATILQEQAQRAAPAQVGQGPRVAGSIAAAQDPETTAASLWSLKQVLGDYARSWLPEGLRGSAPSDRY